MAGHVLPGSLDDGGTGSARILRCIVPKSEPVMEMLLAPLAVEPGSASRSAANPATSFRRHKRIGLDGHVHEIDVNGEFVARTEIVAADADADAFWTFHLIRDVAVPLANGTVDRDLAKNVLRVLPRRRASLCVVRVGSRNQRRLRVRGRRAAVG